MKLTLKVNIITTVLAMGASIIASVIERKRDTKEIDRLILSLDAQEDQATRKDLRKYTKVYGDDYVRLRCAALGVRPVL